jgi:hypothetical protein
MLKSDTAGDVKKIRGSAWAPTLFGVDLQREERMTVGSRLPTATVN